MIPHNSVPLKVKDFLPADGCTQCLKYTRLWCYDCEFWWYLQSSPDNIGQRDHWTIFATLSNGKNNIIYFTLSSCISVTYWTRLQMSE